MQTPILLTSATGAVNNAANRYLTVAGAAGGSSTNQYRIPVPAAGTFSLLRVRLPAALTTGSIQFDVYKNGSSTGLTTTLTAGGATAQENSDTTHSFSVNAGDDIVVLATPSSTPDPISFTQIGLVFEATTAGQSIMLMAHAATASDTFLSPGMQINGAEATVQAIAPCAGTFTALYARRNTSPGGHTVTYTLRINGADTALAAAVTSTTTVSDTDSIAVAAGDLISIGVVATGGAPASSAGGVGLLFVPTVSGEAMVFALATSGFSNSASRYLAPSQAIAQATEADAQGVAPVAFMMKKLRVRVNTAPGSGKSWAFTGRKAGASQALTCSIADSATTGSDASNSFSVAAGDVLGTLIAPTSTPAALSNLSVSYVAYTGAAAGSGYANLLLMGAG